MKKLILALFLLIGCLPCFAGDSNQIRPIYLRNLEVINPNDYVFYSTEGLKIDGDSEDKDDNLFSKVGVKTIFYNKQGKKLGQNEQDAFYNGHFEIKASNIPNNTTSYKLIPIQPSNFDYYSFVEPRFLSIIHSFQVAYAFNDFTYKTPEKLLNTRDGLLSEYSKYTGFKETYPNGYMLNNGIQMFFQVLNNSCKDFNDYDNEQPSEYNACAKIVVDINGYDYPNKITTTEEINDRFKFLLYANKSVPYKNSAEEAIINERPINALLSYSVKDSIRYNYKKWTKNLIISDTYPFQEIIADNVGNKTIIADIEIKYYDKDGKILNTKNINGWEIEPTHDVLSFGNTTTSIYLIQDFSKLNPDIKFFDIIITNGKTQ